MVVENFHKKGFTLRLGQLPSRQMKESKIQVFIYNLTLLGLKISCTCHPLQAYMDFLWAWQFFQFFKTLDVIGLTLAGRASTLLVKHFKLTTHIGCFINIFIKIVPVVNKVPVGNDKRKYIIPSNTCIRTRQWTCKHALKSTAESWKLNQIQINRLLLPIQTKTIVLVCVE